MRAGPGCGHKSEMPEGNSLIARLETRALSCHWQGEDFPNARQCKEVTEFSPCPTWTTADPGGENEFVLFL